MTITDVKKKILIKRIVGASIFALSLYLMLNSLIWGLYITLDVNSGLGVHLAEQLARLYNIIHFLPALDFILKPVFIDSILSENNIYILTYYIVFLISAWLIGSANAQARMLREIFKAIEQRKLAGLAEGSITTPQENSNTEDTELPPIDQARIANHVYFMYLAPLILTIVSAIILKGLGLD